MLCCNGSCHKKLVCCTQEMNIFSDPWILPLSRGHLKPWRKLYFCSFFLTYFFYPLRAATSLCFRIWPSNLCPNLMKSSSIQSKMSDYRHDSAYDGKRKGIFTLVFYETHASQIRLDLSFWGLRMSGRPATVRRGLPLPASPQPGS